MIRKNRQSHIIHELKDGRSVLDELQKIDATYTATNRPDQRAAERIDHHRIFLLMYYYSTVRWVELAETSSLPLIVNGVIVEFYRRYREYVFEQVVDNAACRAAHWQAYFEQADNYRRPSGHISRFRLLNYGVYAHARYDLAEAIAAALGAGNCIELCQHAVNTAAPPISSPGP